MNIQVDAELISNSCNRVKEDESLKWASFHYDTDNQSINVSECGHDFASFANLCQPDNRLYGYLKFGTGDEMSKRTKFVFISWCGDKVPPLKKAQVSTHRSHIKKYIHNFAIELQCYSNDDLNERAILQQLIKAGGANYGTGGR